MNKSTNLWIRMTIILSFLCINSLSSAVAQDCQDCQNNVPTPAGDASYPQDWECDSPYNNIDPLEFDDENTPDTIAAGNSITIYITGGLAPYTFTTSSTGYTFNGGVQTIETNSTSVILSCVSGTCGTNFDAVANIAITDFCNNEITVEIHNNIAEQTVLLESCGVLDGWHQSTCEQDGFLFVVDHYNCSNPQTKSGDMCSEHPCCGCSSYYCPEGSEKWGWGCPND